jgi:uncharacterized membrane protein
MKTRIAAVYALAVVVMVALDALWLGAVARDMYARELGHLLAPQVRWAAAISFYPLYAAGLVALVVMPHRRDRAAVVAGRAALFGLVAYATYGLTNLATLAGWPLQVTLVDLGWGAAVTAATGAAAHALARRIVR